MFLLTAAETFWAGTYSHFLLLAQMCYSMLAGIISANLSFIFRRYKPFKKSEDQISFKILATYISFSSYFHLLSSFNLG